MFKSIKNEILGKRLLVIGITVLIAGQLLYFVGFKALYVIGLVFILAVGLPYPKILQSAMARALAAFLLTFGIIQAAATIQFFILPKSNFQALTLIVTAVVLALVVIMRKHAANKLALFKKVDAAALLTAAFFAVPFALLCFWGNDPLHLVEFGGKQSPDGSAHSMMIGEMGGTQHLTYGTNPDFYPKGFHIADAVFEDSLGLRRPQNSWLVNARVFVGQYIFWGSVLAMMVYYLARQLADKFVIKLKASYGFVLALLLGPVLSLLYLLPFAHQGFLNFYYICATLVLSLLFLPGFGLKSAEDKWFVLAYFLASYGIGMSWGPLLMPISLAIPAMYLVSGARNVQEFFGSLIRKNNLIVLLGAVFITVPLYFYFAYSTSNSFNAYGSVRVLNGALLAAGAGLTMYLLLAKTVPEYVKAFASNALLPVWLLVGALIAAQFIMLGEPRYYSIKTSYILELILIAIAAAALVWVAAKTKIGQFRLWLTLPILFGGSIFFLSSISGNPLEQVRNMLGAPPNFENDTKKVAQLGLAGDLKVSNNYILHYDQARNVLYGSPLIYNWANGINPVNEGNETSAACLNTIFTTLNYGSGSAEEQAVVINAIKACINDRVDVRQKPFYIITDPESLPRLKTILGDKATFL